MWTCTARSMQHLIRKGRITTSALYSRNISSTFRQQYSQQNHHHHHRQRQRQQQQQFLQHIFQSTMVRRMSSSPSSTTSAAGGTDDDNFSGGGMEYLEGQFLVQRPSAFVGSGDIPTTTTATDNQSSKSMVTVLQHDDGRVMELQCGPVEECMVQSLVMLDDPLHLMLPYLQDVMACFALSQHLPPRRILIIGLGGGSALRYIHAMHPQCDIDVVEGCRTVVDFALTYFNLPDVCEIYDATQSVAYDCRPEEGGGGGDGDGVSDGGGVSDGVSDGDGDGRGRLRIITRDAWSFIQHHRNTHMYDIIIQDAVVAHPSATTTAYSSSSSSPPPTAAASSPTTTTTTTTSVGVGYGADELLSPLAFRTLHTMLSHHGGVLVQNLFVRDHPHDNVITTIQREFSGTYYIHTATNTIVFGVSDGGVSDDGGDGVSDGVSDGGGTTAAAAASSSSSSSRHPYPQELVCDFGVWQYERGWMTMEVLASVGELRPVPVGREVDM